MKRRTLVIGIAALAVFSIVALILVSRWDPHVVLPDPVGDAPTISATPAATRARPRVAPPVKFSVDETTDFGTLEGRVVDRTSGEGIEGARITLDHGDGAHAVITESDGTFVFEAPAAGRFEISMVNAEGYFPYAPDWGQQPVVFVARPGQRISDIVFELSAARIVVVEVVDPEGKPVAGAEVEILGAGSGGSSSLPLQRKFQTDEAGHAPVPVPEGGLLEARRDPFAPGRARVDEGAIVSRMLRVQLGPPGSGTTESRSVSGRVVMPNGDPAPNAVVYTRTASDLRPNASTRADRDGLFGLTGLDAGRYDLRAELDGYAGAVQKNVEAGTTDVVLTLSLGGRLRGRVLDASTGSPVAAFTISVAEKVGPIEIGNYDSKSVYDSEGRYEITGLAGGTYRVSVLAQGYSFARPQDVRIPDQGIEVVDFSLRRGGRLTGVVISSEDGEPIPHALVALEGEIPGQGWESDAATPDYRTATNARGAFEIDGIPPGSHSVWVAAGRYNRKIQSGITISEGIETGPITIELSPAPEGEASHTEMVGIGLVLRARGEYLVVLNVIEGSGAEEVGIVPGDKVQAVEGQSVVALGMDGAVQSMRGPEGTSVSVTVVKEDGAVQTLLVPRRRLRV